MAGGVEDDNKDEDAGNKDIPPLLLRGGSKQECLLFDWSPDKKVQDNQGQERNHIEENRHSGGDLKQGNLY